ncbi:MAG: histidine kinase [Chitinophagales bacterium]|nr:histidine kinase [Chitinophagales bacterium]
MRSLLLFIYSFLLFQQQEIIAQDKTCKCISGEQQLRQADTLFEQKEYDKAAEVLAKIPKNTNSCKLEGLCYQLQFYLAKNKMEKADSLVEILQHSEIPKNCLEITMHYHFQLGNYFIKKEKNDEAMQQFILVKELAEQIKDTLFQIKGISRMAYVFNKMQQPEKAIEYDYMSLHLAEKINNKKIALSIYTNIQARFGVWFDITQDPKYLDSVRKIAIPTLQLAKKLNRKFEISQTYSVLSGVAFLEGKYEKGLILCDSGLMFLDRNKEFRLTHSLFTKKCDLYIALKDYKKANQYADSSLRYATLENSVLSLAYIYERMYEIAKLQGDFSSALSYHEKFIKIRDSVRTIEKTEKINELEQKYNKAQNEKTIKELSQAKQIASLRNKIYIAGIILALLIIFLIIIFNRQQTLKSKQENMEVEQRLNRARMNPHFFFNTLNSLQTYSMQENKDSKVARYLSKYAKIMRETLESTYKEMNSVEQEVDYLTNYLDIQKLRYPDKFEYHIDVDEMVEPDETYVPSMIIQPFIENSIEHGLNTSQETGIINISITTNNNRLLINITDNGSGFTTDKKSREYPSRATQIIKDRLLLLNKKHKTDASYEIGKGDKDIGTSVKIILPLIHTHEGFNN